MASEQEAAYHRTFLSRYYVAQVVADSKDSQAPGNRRPDTEITEIRDDDPDAFEDARKALAVLLKVPYRPGTMVNQSRGDVGDRWTYIDGLPPDAQVVEYLKPRNPGAVNPTTGGAAVPNPLVGRIEAYLNGEVLLPTTMFSKMDQQFDDYASPWEKAFSTLMAPYHGGSTPAYAFTPIVDESWQVIGYYGTVQGGQGCRLLVAEGTKEKMKSFIVGGAGIKDFLDKEVLIMVWPGFGRVPGWESGDFGVTDFTYGVRTLPDGTVVSVELVHNRDGVEDTWQPTDLLMAGKALLDLGKLGVVTVKILGGAGRWAGRRILQGATALLARRALQRLAEEFGNEAAELVADTAKAAAKRSGRELTAEAMEKLVRGKWNQNLWLKRLRDAKNLAGAAKTKAVAEVLKDMKRYYGKVAQVVPEGTGQGGRLFEGGVGWALKRETGEQVLAIEQQLLKDPEELYNQVAHDIAFDLVREANGIPGFQLGEMRLSSMSLMEGYIKDGEKAISSFRNLVYGDGT